MISKIENADTLLINYILKKNNGTLITHEEIEDLLYIKSGNSAYYTFMRNISKVLLNYSRGLKVVKGKGYLILGSEAIIDKALKMVQASEDKVANALAMVNKIDRETLDIEYKMKFDLIQTKFIQVHANLSGGVKELYLLNENNRKSKLKEVK